MGKFEQGDRVLFNDRKQPLEVIERTVEDEDVELRVEGPGGAVYVLYSDDGTMLVASEGNRRYSSYLENLRAVGEWEKESKHEWSHSKTEATIVVSEEKGLWNIEFDGFDPEYESPGFGFTEEEAAIEDAEKIVQKYPEGK